MKIVVKTTFEDWHKWVDAPDEVYYLKFPHRHLFYVQISCEVKHDDRELEFFMVKKYLDHIIKSDIKRMEITKSCEQMANRIKNILQIKYKRPFEVAIYEDNENGVVV